jgi:nitroreductase
LSNGFTYVEYYLSRGMKIDDFAANLSFFFSNGMDPEYTVLGRVARRIWSVAMRELYGANERSQKLKYHIQTSGRSLHAQEVDLHVALPNGLHLYDPTQHALRLEVASDVRRVTGYQDFVDQAALDLIFVADHTRMKLVPAARRRAYAFTCAGAMAQNVYLFSASAGLATVVRAWFDHAGLSEAMGLSADHELLLAQTVGHPAA